jgi:hypothetical protein
VGEVRHRRLGDYSLTGATLAGDEDADAFEHLGGRAGSLGQEDVGADGAIGGVDRAGDDHGGQRGLQLLGAADELVTVHLGHEEVTKEEVNGAGGGLLDLFEGLLRGGCLKNAVAAGFEKEGSDGEYLFVGVDAEDDLLRAHAVSILPVTP